MTNGSAFESSGTESDVLPPSNQSAWQLKDSTAAQLLKIRSYASVPFDWACPPANISGARAMPYGALKKE